MSSGNHPIEQEELMAYLDGELSTDRAAATMAHLEQCSECKRLAADLRGVSQSLMAWEVEPSDPLIMRGIAAALDERVWGNAATVSGQTGRDAFQMRRIPLAWIFSLAGVGLALWFGVLLIGSKRSTVFSNVASSIQGADSGTAGKLQAREEGVGGGRDNLGPITRGPMIVRTAKLSLTTMEFDKARAGIEELLRRHRGYLGELNVSTPAGVGRTLSATLRVPADQLEATMTELRQLGRAESESQSGEDVTSQYVDLEARLSNAKNAEQRLTDLLRQRTGKLADALAVETEISRVRGEIERMEAQRKNLANQVDFATVNATVTEDYKAQLQMMPPSTSTRIRNAAVDGYRSVVDGVVGLAVFLVSYGPSLLFWGGLLFLPFRSVWRRLRRAMAPLPEGMQ